MVKALVAVAVIVVEPPSDTLVPLIVTALLTRPAFGKPVALVSTTEDGVPKAGVTSVGLVANTSAPLPVSLVTAAAKLAELGVPKNVATPVPKAVRPVPPEAAASGEASVRLDRWSFWKLKLVPSDHTVTVLPAGMVTPTPALVVSPRTVEL
jgi:hypothetical protein